MAPEALERCILLNDMLFSIIIPLYNKAPYVKRALESIINQSRKGFEVIIIDDGSTDESYSIAKEYLEQSDIRYILFHQDNVGVSATRNKGVSLSHGKYLCFLDADDWWSPLFLERMELMIRTYPEAGIYGTNYYYVKYGKERVCVTDSTTGYINYFQEYVKRLRMPLWTGAVCVPRVVFDEMGGFKTHLSLGEDFDLWVRIALKYKVAFLNEPCSYYNQDSNPSWRLVSKLHNPDTHMLWNMDYLSDEENNNPCYKQLIDALRTYDLFPYYLSHQYHNEAKKELEKVDWNKQPRKIRRLYKQPLFLLRCRHIIFQFGSKVKQWIIRHL